MSRLVEHVLDMYRDPVGGRYRTKLERTLDETASPQALPFLELPLATILSV